MWTGHLEPFEEEDNHSCQVSESLFQWSGLQIPVFKLPMATQALNIIRCRTHDLNFLSVSNFNANKTTSHHRSHYASRACDIHHPTSTIHTLASRIACRYIVTIEGLLVRSTSSVTSNPAVTSKTDAARLLPTAHLSIEIRGQECQRIKHSPMRRAVPCFLTLFVCGRPHRRARYRKLHNGMFDFSFPQTTPRKISPLRPSGR
jgi:hypothetical protein